MRIFATSNKLLLNICFGSYVHYVYSSSPRRDSIRTEENRGPQSPPPPEISLSLPPEENQAQPFYPTKADLYPYPQKPPPILGSSGPNTASFVWVSRPCSFSHRGLRYRLATSFCSSNGAVGLLRCRAWASFRFRSWKIRTSLPASLSAGAI